MEKSLYTLVPPDLSQEKEFKKFYAGYEMAQTQPMIRSVQMYDGNFSQYVQKLRAEENEATVPKGLVPASTFFLSDETKAILGVIQIRHFLNDFLRQSGGHIGYEIAPQYRGKGLGTKLLELGMQKAKSMGISDILVICNKDNIPSAKVIQKNGGVFENEIVAEGVIKKRYRIQS